MATSWRLEVDTYVPWLIPLAFILISDMSVWTVPVALDSSHCRKHLPLIGSMGVLINPVQPSVDGRWNTWVNTLPASLRMDTSSLRGILYSQERSLRQEWHPSLHTPVWAFLASMITHHSLPHSCFLPSPVQKLLSLFSKEAKLRQIWRERWTDRAWPSLCHEGWLRDRCGFKSQPRLLQATCI